MIRANLIAERVAIEAYTKDSTTRRLLEDMTSSPTNRGMPKN